MLLKEMTERKEARYIKGAINKVCAKVSQSLTYGHETSFRIKVEIKYKDHRRPLGYCRDFGELTRDTLYALLLLKSLCRPWGRTLNA